MQKQIIAAFVAFVLSVLAGCGSQEFALSPADQALVDAKKAIGEGDSAKALELLDISINERPDPWSYFERAKLHADNGDDDSAKADVDAGLGMEPEHAELLWLQKQLKKSKNTRFKGSSGQPPSASK